MTTKFDLIRDCLIDLLHDFRLSQRFNTSNNAEDDDWEDRLLDNDTVNELSNQILYVLEDNNVVEEQADKDDFAIRVICKKADTPYGDIVPEENTKESEIL